MSEINEQVISEILKACKAGFTHDIIAENCDLSEEEIRTIIETNMKEKEDDAK